MHIFQKQSKKSTDSLYKIEGIDPFVWRVAAKKYLWFSFWDLFIYIGQHFTCSPSHVFLFCLWTAGAAYNIGIFHWRPTESSIKLAKEWKELLLADEKIWDQNGFNELVRRQLGPPVDEDSGLVYAYDGNLKLGLLPASIFCSGHTYFVQVFCNFCMHPHCRLNIKESDLKAQLKKYVLR